MTKSRKTTNQREEEILRALQQAGGAGLKRLGLSCGS